MRRFLSESGEHFANIGIMLEARRGAGRLFVAMYLN